MTNPSTRGKGKRMAKTSQKKKTIAENMRPNKEKGKNSRASTQRPKSDSAHVAGKGEQTAGRESATTSGSRTGGNRRRLAVRGTQHQIFQRMEAKGGDV